MTIYWYSEQQRQIGLRMGDERGYNEVMADNGDIRRYTECCTLETVDNPDYWPNFPDAEIVHASLVDDMSEIVSFDHRGGFEGFARWLDDQI